MGYNLNLGNINLLATYEWCKLDFFWVWIFIFSRIKLSKDSRPVGYIILIESEIGFRETVGPPVCLELWDMTDCCSALTFRTS